MSSAAEAIMSASAPPPRPAAGKAAAPEAPGPSFDEHLAAEEAPEADALGGAQQDDDAPTVESKDSEKSAAETQTAAPTLPPAPQQQAPAIVLQLIAQASGDAPPTEAPTNEAPPVDAAPAPSAPTDAAPNNAPIDANTEAQAAHGFAKALEKSAAPDTKREAQPQTSPAQTAQVQPAAPPSTTAQAAPIQPANTNAKSTPTKVTPDSNADGEEAPDFAPATVEPPPVSPRPPEPRVTKATEPSKTSDDSSVQEKLAAAIESAAPQIQAKAQMDRAIPAPMADVQQATASSAPDTPLQQLNALSSANAASATQAVATDPIVARATPAAAQVAREIVRRFDGETTKFEMRLDPPELGRVEVRLEVTRDHKVTAVLSADSPQALTELARHARELEQSLQSAGLELSDAGLSFDLSQSREDGDDASGQNSSRGASSSNEDLEQAPLARPIGLERWRGVRVDVMV